MTGSWPLHELPNLNSNNHQITSPRKNRYNCIAWAAGIDTQWWWPEPVYYYWPKRVPREVTLDAFVAVFSLLGYEECLEHSLEEGYDKVVLYAKYEGGLLKPTHAAKQLPNGKWTSKLGNLEDIEHTELDDVSGPIYGAPVRFLRRLIA